jgi:hypothetical protein
MEKRCWIMTWHGRGDMGESYRVPKARGMNRPEPYSINHLLSVLINQFYKSISLYLIEDDSAQETQSATPK